MTKEWTKLEEELLSFCADFLYELANFEDIEALYWVTFGDGEGDRYCLDCCEKEVDKINKEFVSKGEEPEAIIDGGWGGIDEDGCTFCYSCNVRLDASLTQYGIESEVDHFLSCGLIDQKELSNNQLIELYEIFYYSNEWDFSKQYKKDILRLAVIVSSCLGKSFEVNNRFELLDL